MQNKLNWMLTQMEDDGFENITKEILISILEGGEESHDSATVDYVLELESEWATEGNS